MPRTAPWDRALRLAKRVCLIDGLVLIFLSASVTDEAPIWLIAALGGLGVVLVIAGGGFDVG